MLFGNRGQKLLKSVKSLLTGPSLPIPDPDSPAPWLMTGTDGLGREGVMTHWLSAAMRSGASVIFLDLDPDGLVGTTMKSLVDSAGRAADFAPVGMPNSQGIPGLPTFVRNLEPSIQVKWVQEFMQSDETSKKQLNSLASAIAAYCISRPKESGTNFGREHDIDFDKVVGIGCGFFAPRPGNLPEVSVRVQNLFTSYLLSLKHGHDFICLEQGQKNSSYRAFFGLCEAEHSKCMRLVDCAFSDMNFTLKGDGRSFWPGSSTPARDMPHALKQGCIFHLMFNSKRFGKTTDRHKSLLKSILLERIEAALVSVRPGQQKPIMAIEGAHVAPEIVAPLVKLCAELGIPLACSAPSIALLWQDDTKEKYNNTIEFFSPRRMLIGPVPENSQTMRVRDRQAAEAAQKQACGMVTILGDGRAYQLPRPIPVLRWPALSAEPHADLAGEADRKGPEEEKAEGQQMAVSKDVAAPDANATGNASSDVSPLSGVPTEQEAATVPAEAAKAPSATVPNTARATSVVVIKAIGNENISNAREISRAYDPVIGTELPLIQLSEAILDRAEAALIAEFPHAVTLTRRLLTPLRGQQVLAFAPIILVGSPGCGKSTYAPRFFELLGVPSQTYSCGGVSDDSLGGTARRWSSGQPSLPLELVIRHRIASPGVVLDELEKPATGRHNGNLFDVLTSFLEPGNAKRFADPFIQAPVDLSHVLWMATANSVKGIPAPIRDRLRVLKFPSPKAEHLPQLGNRLLEEVIAQRGLNKDWAQPLDGEELSALAEVWPGKVSEVDIATEADDRCNSLRALRKLVEAVVDARDTWQGSRN